MIFQITQTMRRMMAVKRRLRMMRPPPLQAQGGWSRLSPPGSPGWTLSPSSLPSRSHPGLWWSQGSRMADRRPPALLRRKIKTQGIISKDLLVQGF